MRKLLLILLLVMLPSMARAQLANLPNATPIPVLGPEDLFGTWDASNTAVRSVRGDTLAAMVLRESGLTANRCLRTNASGQIVVATADCPDGDTGGGGGATELDDLTDVTITTPSSGHLFRYNGASWVNTLLAAGDIPDISATYCALAGCSMSGALVVSEAGGIVWGTVSGDYPSITSNGTDFSFNTSAFNPWTLTASQLYGTNVSSTLRLQNSAGGSVTFDPLNTAGNGTMSFPTTSATVATLALTETLTNKTLTAPTLNNPILTLVQSANPTPTAEGRTEWDTDDNRFAVGDGTGTQVFHPGAHTTDTNTNADTQCTGSTTYLDGEGNCDDISSVYQADLDVPSQAEAEAGTATTERVWTAQRVAQAVAALETDTNTQFNATTTHEQIPFNRSGVVASSDSVKWDGDPGELGITGEVSITTDQLPFLRVTGSGATGTYIDINGSTGRGYFGIDNGGLLSPGGDYLSIRADANVTGGLAFGASGSTIHMVLNASGILALTDRIQLGSLTAASASCIDIDTDRPYADKDCDSVKDAGEEYLDASGGAETNDLEATDPPTILDTEIYIGTGAGTGAFAAMSGDATMANTGAVTVADDSHNHVIANIDAFTSAALRGQISDETGTGAAVFAGGAIGAATATTPSADDNDTSVATTAYVQGEINGAGGTGLSCSSGQCNVDLGTSIASSEIETIVFSVPYDAGALVADGANCANAAEVTIGSWGKMWTVICTDNDGSTLTGKFPAPDSWDGGTLVFHLSVIQDAADTNAFQSDVSARCVGDTETPAAYGTEVALDDTMTGSDAINKMTSAAVTPSGTCAAGDLVQFQIAIDATGTTTAMATLNIVGVVVEFTSNVGD